MPHTFWTREEPFLVISGDAITDIDLTEVIRFHKERGGAVTIALKRVPDPLDFGVVITAEDGLVERFWRSRRGVRCSATRSTPESTWSSPGCSTTSRRGSPTTSRRTCSLG